MPFQFDQYRSPFVGSISELMQAPGQAQALAAQQIGQAQANAALQSGQAWAGAAQNIGQAVSAIPAQIQQARAQQQHGQLVNAQIADARAQAQQREVAAKRQQGIEQANQAIDTIMQKSMKPDPTTGVVSFDRPSFEQGLVSSGMGHLYPTMAETLDKLDASAAKRNTEARSMLAHTLVGIEQAGFTPSAVLSGAAFLKANGVIQGDQLQPVLGAIADDPSPENVKRVVAGLGQQIPEYQALKTAEEKRTTDLAKTKADTSKNEAEAAKLRAEVAGTMPKPSGAGTIHDTPQGLVRIGADNSITPLGVQGYHPPAAGTAGGAGGLDPDAIDYTATQYRILGPSGIPTRIEGPDRVKILNAAAKQAKSLGQTPAQAVQKQAAFKADAGSLNKIQNMAASAEAFETKANAQAELVRELSKKVSRSEWPIVNGAIISGKQLTGDTDAHLFANGLLTFTTEYAKLMEGSTGSAAGSSEGARKDAARLISTALNNGTIDKTLSQMQWEMQQTRRGYDATIAHITDKMGGAPQTPTVAPVEWERGPDGKPRRKAGG